MAAVIALEFIGLPASAGLALSLVGAPFPEIEAPAIGPAKNKIPLSKVR
jgi:hypothetical protein